MLCNLKEAARIAIAENSGLPAFSQYSISVPPPQLMLSV